jgi:hypothetical protein
MTHHETPRMTVHARVRCLEMGISTKRAKRVVQNRTGTYPGNPKDGNNTRMVLSADPDIAVVWAPDTNYILTVLPRVQENYVRTPNGFEVKP